MNPTSAIAPPPPPSSSEAMKTPSKSRSFSDPPNKTPTANILAPSPAFREKIVRLTSKDDHDAAPPTTPKPSRRPLSLQMPSPAQFPAPPQRSAPLSPQLDRNNIYMQPSSPATSLPRHSRGLDFSRHCTNLHHSTLAESSPDSSPVVLQKPLLVPGGRRRSRQGSIGGMVLDSPGLNVNVNVNVNMNMNMDMNTVPWGIAAARPPERSAVSSSVGSVNMLASESESNDSDGEDASMGGDGDDNEDPILTTPQVHKLQNPNAPTPFAGAPSTPGGGGLGLWAAGSHFSPAQASLMKTIRRSRLQKHGKKNRKSSSSASGSGYSSMASPRTTSPPPLRSIESAANGGYFNWPTAARSRRESLALGTDGLHLSSGNDSGDEASANTNTNSPSTPGVVRRPVTRRGNLLPKTKGFARIRAALMEEAAPIDTEVRREAETIRQVRERDGSLVGLDLTPSERSQTAVDPSSPSLLPAVPEGVQEDLGKDLSSDDTTNAKGLGMNFAAHASRNSGGMDYWNRYDASLRTPPPLAPPNFTRQSSSVISDINMESSSDTTHTETWHRPRPRSRSSASDVAAEVNNAVATGQGQGQVVGSGGGVLMSDDMHLNRFKRRREDDFDISTIKRRAVSPGMSANNSPVLTQSPSQKEANVNWGQPPDRIKDGKSQSQSQPVSASSETSMQQSIPAAPSRHGSGGSSTSLASGSTALGPSGSGSISAPGSSGGGGGGGPGGGGKKLGLQGMVDTNDGLMKMSIE